MAEIEVQAEGSMGLYRRYLLGPTEVSGEIVSVGSDGETMTLARYDSIGKLLSMKEQEIPSDRAADNDL